MRTRKTIRKISGAVKSFFRRQSKRLIFVAVILLILGVLELYTRQVTASLYDQNEGTRWSQEGDAAQISCFFAQSANITTESIRQFEYNISQALADASVTRDLSKSGSRLFADCYSALGHVVIEGRAGNVTVNACGIGGDFFMFHPVPLVQGTYFSGTDLMQDSVVVDEDLAWQIFGSNDIVGKTLTFGGVPHTIVGVSRREKGKLLERAGRENSFLYLSFDSLTKYGTVTGAGLLRGTTAVDKYGNAGAGGGSYSDAGWAASVSGDTPVSGISCYEVVMPDLVRNFAKKLVTEKLGVAEEQRVIVDNTNRFGVPELLKVAASFGSRSMQLLPVNYPYWENEARGWEDILALVLVFKLLCIAVLFLALCVFIVQAYRHKTWTVAGIVRTLSERRYERAARRRYGSLYDDPDESAEHEPAIADDPDEDPEYDPEEYDDEYEDDDLYELDVNEWD